MDELTGTASANVLQGYGGADVLRGGAGADTLEGGLGTDTASYYEGSVGVTVSLDTGKGSTGDAEGDTLSGIETLSGSQGHDVLTGDAGGNTLQGWNGNDTLIGNALYTGVAGQLRFASTAPASPPSPATSTATRSATFTSS